MFRLRGKNAIITGGGGGIGAAIASGFAELGADIALLDLNSASVEAVKKDLERRFPTRVIALTVDVQEASQVNSAVSSIIGTLGRIHILVNGHGIGQWAAAEDMDERDWDRMIDVNLKSVFLMCQAVGRHMIAEGGGKIINIASISGSIANKPQSQSHYNTSKAAVIMLTKSLAAEWARHNVNVNSVSPGYTLTPLFENLMKTRPEHIGLWKQLIPKGRFAMPSDVVGAVVFLASEAADYVTGHDLVVDGGYTIW